jgi:hypothetical protein
MMMQNAYTSGGSGQSRDRRGRATDEGEGGGGEAGRIEKRVGESVDRATRGLSERGERGRVSDRSSGSRWWRLGLAKCHHWFDPASHVGPM